MAPLLLLALLLVPAPARAADAKEQVRNAAAQSDEADDEDDDDAVSERAARPFDANAASDRTVVAPGVTRKASPLARSVVGAKEPKVEPPAVVEKKPSKSKISSGLVMAGAAALGGLQGWFAAGLLGAVAGAGLGLAAAYLFHKKNYGAAFGVTAGAIIGTAFGGPIGGVIGAVVGGVIGHFLGKLFG